MLSATLTLTHAPANRSIDPRLHDGSIDTTFITGAIKAGCLCLQASGTCSFRFTAFGRQWPFDVECDLCALLEQALEILAWLDSGDQSPGRLDFYEQGSDLFLLLTPDGGRISASANVVTGEHAEPLEDSVSREDLREMICTISVDFLSHLRSCCPDIAELPPLVEWANELSKRCSSCG